MAFRRVVAVGAALLSMTTFSYAGVVLPNVNPAVIEASISLDGSTPANIQFINKLNYSVDVYWIDYTGQKELYNQLGANSSYVQETFLTHPWLILASGTNAPITGFASAITPASLGSSPDIANIGGVPEPSTWAMMLIGFAGLAYAVGRKQTSGGAAFSAA